MIAYAELYVADAPVSLAYFTQALAFRQVAVATAPGRRSVLLHNGGVPLVITAPTGPAGPVADWLALHGDGVANIAMYTDSDLADVAERAQRAGLQPTKLEASSGRGTIRTRGVGALVHTVIERGDVAPELPPGFHWRVGPGAGVGSADPALCLTGIDHIAVCLPTGELDVTAAAYQRAFGLEGLRSEHIEVGETGMRSHILRGGGLTYVMAEGDPDRRPGQVEEFVSLHKAGGVQHLAFGTCDIVAAVRAMGPRGVRFLPTPDSYYDDVAVRMAGTPAVLERLPDLHETRVLADRDERGHLLQIFAASPFERGTVFIELVERGGASTFGTDNVRRLFAARERAVGEDTQPVDLSVLSA